MVRKLLSIVALVAAATACTPDQINFWSTTVAPYHGTMPGEALDALIDCESGGNPQAVGGGGRYRGLGQFVQSTWDGVARRHFPWLEGIDPIDAEPAWQRAMILALYSEAGGSPWPICARRAGL